MLCWTYLRCTTCTGYYIFSKLRMTHLYVFSLAEGPLRRHEGHHAIRVQYFVLKRAITSNLNESMIFVIHVSEYFWFLQHTFSNDNIFDQNKNDSLYSLDSFLKACFLNFRCLIYVLSHFYYNLYFSSNTAFNPRMANQVLNFQMMIFESLRTSSQTVLLCVI